MKHLVQIVVIVAALLSSSLIQAQKSKGNSMAYHEVQGIELKVGYFSGKSMDTYYLLITNSPDQFAAPRRLVLGVDKKRAMADLEKILEYMNTGKDFIYTDKTGTEYTFSCENNRNWYTITWEGSDNGYCPVSAQPKSIEKSMRWIASTTTKKEAEELLVKRNDNSEMTPMNFAYAPAIKFAENK